MSEEKLDRLIELNEKIVKQNDEIIDLLKQLNGSDEESSCEEEAELPQKEEETVVKDVSEHFSTAELSEGEVLFVANSQDNQVDIYRLSVRQSDELKVTPPQIENEIRNNFEGINYEITLDNLTGTSLTSQFKTPLLVAIESLNNNEVIPSDVCILNDESFVNLPDILRVAIENGAKTIYSSIKNSMAVLQAPPMIMDYLTFYKNDDDLLEKLF